MQNYLEFEKPLAEIESKAAELRLMAEKSEDDVNVDAEASALDKKAQSMLQELYKNLNPWRKCQVARHQDRPHCKDYIQELFTEYTPQTRIEGDIQQMPSDFPVTELQEIIKTNKRYTRKNNEITVFDSVGFALEDYSTLNFYNNLSNKYRVGENINLISKTNDPKNLFSLLK